MKNQIKICFLFVVGLLLMTACSKTTEVEKPAPSKKEPREEIVEEKQYIAPFTGVQSDEEYTMRPVLATINNHPLARPQSGISDADLIYEFIVEGNTTRLLALFQSELPTEIGPIRSARDGFLEVAKGLDAFYVAHGYSPSARAQLDAGYVDHVNGMQYDGTLFKRSSDRKAPHNSYISGENILVAAEKIDASMTMQKDASLSFHESIEDVKIEEEASTITVQNGTHPNFTSNYAYNQDDRNYQQKINDVITIDKATDQVIELANILVFEAEHQTIDNEGRQAIDIKTGGKGLLFQAGKVKDIEWENINGQMTPVENGVPVELVPGKTWVHILRTSAGLDTNVSYTP